LGDDPLIVFREPQSLGAEQFRSLRNTLALRWFKHPEGARTLAVVSPTEFEGRGAVAANLAIAFAQAGFQTLLIDADMRTPSQHQLFNVDGISGLAGYLAGWGGDSPLYEMGNIANPAVIPVGSVPPNPQDLLVRGMLQDLLTEAKNRFEVILVNTPAASVASDYLLIGADTAGMLIVTVGGQTRASDAAKLIKDSKEFGIRIVGSIMVEQE
jgi:capsular exopolysaccharide synthesis family protein